MRKFVLILAFVLTLTMSFGTLATAHDNHNGIPDAPYCGHADHYYDYGYSWEGYLGHGDYTNHYGGYTHWHLYEIWYWDYYWGWYFWDYEWKMC